MRRGGRERERRALADVETMWKKQERVEEGARSLRSLLEYVNWHRHPDPSFNELSNGNELCDRINEGLYYQDLIFMYKIVLDFVLLSLLSSFF